MTKHKDIAQGFHKGDKVALNNLWDKLTVELNNAGPPIKTTSNWKKVSRNFYNVGLVKN